LQALLCKGFVRKFRSKTFHQIDPRFAKREIPKSPYHVNVEGFAGDASKVTAAGPGLEPEGVVINRPTYFDIFAEGAGKGTPEVIILDPKGKKDSAPIKITPSNEKPDVYRYIYSQPWQVQVV
jgi:filamin